jgi:NAD(P)H-hydrate repair Nnr-like enzyme with NAD(P)H-hydrate dehydratase domain
MINSTGNSGLARGGSGDVLTGLLLGILAQGLDAFSASICAVYLHGSAADLAAAETSVRTLLPTDVISFLPASFQNVGWSGALRDRTL